jgi:hypothetical protein
MNLTREALRRLHADPQPVMTVSSRSRGADTKELHETAQLG